MKKLVFISSLVLLTVTHSFSQKEESLKEQAIDDIESLSSKNYPYIEQFHEAVREKMSGNYEEAKRLLDNCLTIKQDDDAVYFALAEIAKKENNASVALRNLKKAYAIDSSNIAYLQELAFTHFERANFEEAELLFKSLIEKEPRNLDIRYGYSKILIYNKAYELAIDELNTLQDQAGIVPELMNMKADLYVELKQFDKAEETLLKLKSEYPNNKDVIDNIVHFYKSQGEEEKAKELIKTLAEENPTNKTAQLALANDLYEQEKFSKFLELTLPIIESQNISVKEKLTVLNQIREVTKKDDEIRLTAAKSLFESHPKDVETAEQYVNALINQGDSKKALTIARQSAKDNPENYDAWHRVLIIATVFNDFQALYDDGKTALEYFPSLPSLYFFTAEGALKLDKPDEAMQLLAGGEIYILDDTQREALFSMRKGEIFFYKKEYKKGILAFEKALSDNKKEVSIPLSYARCLSEANIATEVAQELLSTIPPESQSTDFYIAKAKLAMHKGELKEGIDILEDGIKTLSNNAELYDLLGDLYFKKESINKAKEAWNMALTNESRNKNLTKKINEEKLYAPKYY
ncbi:tetratricopeptide repeat protein [Brumimicrobium aurantiacum]|uniref:Uncharacterized protein n=1 Tax=Brumimicrobium aurantiacum TaxID=1737063 RepID=A0A3E1EX99_9FLAO|nr:tetratricopeptide repeat protein [Brumimicrobium aurantiacum]RFC54186.1 hypothetical protein DXU93_09375 [Brumimicrobium aurantiacum]